mmetsp:Transcript_6762/g.17221  ORF Transcript_6762/g.17221 Transcript_6762/m.17221 type:complete len:565 (-) Transcript_6762:1165-2859(-)
MSLTDAVPHLYRLETLLRLADRDAPAEAGEDREQRRQSQDGWHAGGHARAAAGQGAAEEAGQTESPADDEAMDADMDPAELWDSVNQPLLTSGRHRMDSSRYSSMLEDSMLLPQPKLPEDALKLRWLRILASCLVISSNGVQYALSQFMPYLDGISGDEKSSLTSAISLLICFFTLGCIFHGCFLMKHLSGPRVSIVLTSPLVLMLMLSVVALRLKSEWLLLLAFSMTGFGIGPSYLSAIIHLQFWLPQSPALASSIGMAFGGLGSVLMAMLIELTIQTYGINTSFIILALFLFLLQVVGGVFIQMPEMSATETQDLMRSYRSSICHSVRGVKPRNKAREYSGDLGIELGFGELLCSWQFMLFWFCTFAGVGPGYGLFANLAMILNRDVGMSASQTSLWVILINLLATIFGRLPTGYIADLLNSSRRKCFASGSRTLFMLLHGIQGIILLVLPIATSSGNTIFSLFLITSLSCVFAGCNVLVASLSRELFAPINSTVVYSLILTATAASSLTFPNAMPLLYKLTGNDRAYSWGVAAVSMVGTVVCIVLQPLSKAFMPIREVVNY